MLPPVLLYISQSLCSDGVGGAVTLARAHGVWVDLGLASELLCNVPKSLSLLVGQLKAEGQ